MNDLMKLFSDKPYLAWYVKDTEKMSKESMLEQVLNYGDWGDYLTVEKALGIQNTKKLFMGLRGKKRSNLRKKTINYFNRYFERYA